MLTAAKVSTGTSSLLVSPYSRSLGKESAGQIVIRKYSSDAGCFGENFKSGAGLYQLQLMHDAMPSIVFRVNWTLDDFSKDRYLTAQDLPG
jgi:hypothetical protein